MLSLTVNGDNTMGAQLFHQTRRQLMTCAALCGLILVLVSMGIAQTRTPARNKQAAPAAFGPEQFTSLAEQLGPLLQRLQREVKFPPARTESRLLPRLPEGTTFYVALPNYGEAAHQALSIFKQELQNNAALSEWWHKAGATAPKVEDYVERFYLLSQYLGDEIVVSGTVEGDKPKLLLLAEVRNPGLKVFLQQALKQAGQPSTGIRVLDPQELSAAKEPASKKEEELVLLVRPDLVVGALDLATLRSFNAALDSGRRDFLASPFGQRLAQSYGGGVTLLGGADLERIISKIPQGTDQSKAVLQSTGFADLKYAIWEHKSAAGQDVSQMELSFTGPRHGIASWLGAPATLGSLEFVSPKPMMVASIALASPAQMFDDIQQLATASNPNAFASLAQFEQALQLSLRNDVLAQLGGEITLELDSVAPPAPVWKAILRVNDAHRLQQTLSTLLTAARLSTQQFVEGGLAYYPVQIPSGKVPLQIEYAFADGYWIIGSSHAVVADAIRLHSDGGSLGKSAELAAALPPGHPEGISAMYYQDPIAMAVLQLQQKAPGIAAALAQSDAERKPVVMCLYGEETAIRQASTAPAADAGVVLAIAAIAIPNLLRSKVAANEASAVGTLRSVVTAQVTYQASYPARGYAPSLATLGPGPIGDHTASANHAAFLADPPAGASCTAGAWCTKSGYRFTVTASCRQQRCRDFAVVAVPVTANSTGVRSFCSTSDGVIRFKADEAPTAPITAAQCRQWAPLK